MLHVASTLPLAPALFRDQHSTAQSWRCPLHAMWRPGLSSSCVHACACMCACVVVATASLPHHRLALIWARQLSGWWPTTSLVMRRSPPPVLVLQAGRVTSMTGRQTGECRLHVLVIKLDARGYSASWLWCKTVCQPGRAGRQRGRSSALHLGCGPWQCARAGGNGALW